MEALSHRHPRDFYPTLKLVLATLYGAFSIERRGASETVKERFTFTMNPVGLQVTVRHRER